LESPQRFARSKNVTSVRDLSFLLALERANWQKQFLVHDNLIKLVATKLLLHNF